MSFFESIILGIIQGLTEFFPISSSGHLIIVEQFFGVETEYGVLFNVILHIGTLVAVCFAFRKDVLRLFYSYLGILVDLLRNFKILLKNLFKNQDNAYRKILRTQYRKLAALILAANIPTVFIGFLLRKFVAGTANSLYIAGVGLLVTGLLLFVTGFHETGNKRPKDATVHGALVIGVCQGFSVIPGLSRFGTTMAAGLLGGYNKMFALKYSFLMSIPAILGAMVLELFKVSDGSGLTLGFVISCITGAAFAAVSGYFAIKALIWIVKKDKLRIFAYYCFIVGIMAIVLNYLV